MAVISLIIFYEFFVSFVFILISVNFSSILAFRFCLCMEQDIVGILVWLGEFWITITAVRTKVSSEFRILPLAGDKRKIFSISLGQVQSRDHQGFILAKWENCNKSSGFREHKMVKKDVRSGANPANLTSPYHCKALFKKVLTFHSSRPMTLNTSNTSFFPPHEQKRLSLAQLNAYNEIPNYTIETSSAS